MKNLYDPQLKEQRIYAQGKELASLMGKDKDEQGNRVYRWPEETELYVTTIKNPVLVTDVYKINKLKPTLRDTVFALYASPKKITVYDNTSLEFEQGKYNGVWGPSIDTLLFCRALNKEKKRLETAKKAIEIGSGSGFISKYALDNLSSLEEIMLIDLNPKAEECARNNIADSRAKFFTGDGINFLEELNEKYDLIICNPPYIPRPESIDDNPYEGLNLLAYLIENAGKYLTDKGIFMTNISSLSENIINEVIKKSDVTVRAIDSMKVPLKVYNVLNNKEWMDYLLNEKGLKKAKFNKNGYDYWHRINIVEIRKN